MRVLILITAFLFFNMQDLFSSSFYFSSSAGDDSFSAEQARNPDTPWKSIDMLNQSMGLMQAGDSILFKRGDRFVGQINVTCSGNSNNDIVFGAYGVGEDPIISGFVNLGNWTETSPNIWAADASILDPVTSILLIDGVSQQIGRYPNTDDENNGYLVIEDHGGDRTVFNASLNNTVNFTGADAIIRTRRWLVDRKRILSHNGGQLTLVDPTRFNMIDGFGFFIQNHLGTLDQNGEWFHDGGNNKMYLYSTFNPNSLDVLVSANSTVVNVSDEGYLAFRNLEIEGGYDITFSIENGNHVSINGCFVNNSGMDGIVVRFSSHIDVLNSMIHKSKNNALGFGTCSYVTIRNNEIKSAGLKVGMGSGQSYQYSGIVFAGTNCLCEYNQISSIGYSGIQFSGDFITIKNNLIEDFCMVLDDGGGVYTSGNGESIYRDRLISGNVILNGIGAGLGTDYPSEFYASGIYLDDRANDVTIKGNTVANCSDNGIFIHNSHDFSIIENTLYNNDNQLRFSHDYSYQDYPIVDGQIANNIFYAKLADQSIAEFLTIYRNEIASFGLFENNYYCRPVEEDKTIKIWIYSENQIQFELINLDEWKAQYNHDLNSERTSYKIPTYSVVSDNGYNLVDNGSFDVDVSRWHCWSSNNNCVLNWSNTSALDNGSMQISTTQAPDQNDGMIQATGVCGEINKDNSYVLRFSALSSNTSKYLKAVLKDQNSPYEMISNSGLAELSDHRQEHELLFLTDTDVASSTINFIVDDDGSEYWLDNIELVKAVVELENTLESIVFVHNASEEDLVVDDGSSYIDVAGQKYQQLIVEPFKSKILLKVSPDYNLHSKEHDQQVYLMVYPNPAEHTVNSYTNDDSLKLITVTDHSGRVLLQQQFNSTSYSVDISDLHPGMYVLTQEGDNRRISTQLLVR